MNIEVKNGTYEFHGNEIGFSFYTDLNAVNKVKFVNAVTEYVVGENYNSVIRDLMFDFELIDIFTDIDLTEIRESVDILSRIEEFLSETKAVDIVKANMADGLLQSLNEAVDDNIAYRTGSHNDPVSKALSLLINTVNDKIKSINMNELMEAAQKLNSITGELSTDSILEAYKKSDLYEDRMLNNAKEKA